MGDGLEAGLDGLDVLLVAFKGFKQPMPSSLITDAVAGVLSRLA
jgi:hypothetical protein